MATITERERLREEEELAVGPLLARAKLFRIRGQWDEAITACTDVLRKFPASITACSLLGEIYEAQGRLDDAIQWYGMALERDSLSNSDRSGLERVSTLKARQNAEAAVVQRPMDAPVPAAKPVGEKTLEWFDRLFPPGDSQSIARMLYAVSGVIGALLIVSGVAFYLFFQNKTHRDSPDLPPPGSALSGLPAPAVPVVVEPSVHASPTPGQPAIVASPSSNPIAVQPSPSTNNSDESKLLGEINGLLNNAFVVESIHREGGEGRVAVELLVPAGETVDKSREIVLRDTAATVRLLGQADSSIQTASVRASMPSVTNATVPVMVFSGDLAVSAVREVDPTQLSYMDMLSRFSRLQWEGSLVPNAESGTPPNPGTTSNGTGNGLQNGSGTSAPGNGNRSGQN